MRARLAARRWRPPSRRWLTASANQHVQDNVRVAQLVEAYKAHGHLIAKIDPLQLALADPLRAPFYLQDVGLLQPETYGLRCDQAMLRTRFWIGDSLDPLLPGPEHKLEDILRALREAYCGPIGTQFMHILRPDCREWVDRRLREHAMHRWEPEQQRRLLDKIAEATFFEEYFGKRLSGAKRFSLEGTEALVPGLEALFERSAEVGIRSIEMGMTHRGRLNVLKNIMHVPLEALLYRFQEYLPDDNEHPNNSNDVRYHLGTSTVRAFGDRRLRVSLAANPSHLEAVNSVVLGKTRARQFLLRGTVIEDDTGGVHVYQSPKRGSVDYSPSDEAKREAMALLLHGDASFYQGSVRESLGFSNLRDYTTGGTVHIILNNQIGFTTMPKEAHSSVYCSDVALSIGAPVFHVNGNDPEAVALVCRTAVDYRQAFGRDCVVNIWAYRRHGHNEQDDPKLTQPIMYSCIEKIPTLCKLYGQQLLERGVVDSQEALEAIKARLMVEFSGGKDMEGVDSDGRLLTYGDKRKVLAMWNELGLLSDAGDPAAFKLQKSLLLETLATGVDTELLRSFGRAIFTLPGKSQFCVHPKVSAVYKDRLESVELGAGKVIRWATAEALAFASLLAEGFHIRLSGQDVERGTFNQRHAVLYDQLRAVRSNEVIYKPWTALQDLDWHAEDIRRSMAERAEPGDADVSGTGPKGAEEDSPEEETLFAGHYEFGAAGRLPSESRTVELDNPKIESALEKIRASMDSRAQRRRETRAVLRWRGPHQYSAELGEMEVCNSPLSEEAVLGFEHGYSLYSPDIMTIWEAQFGDFANCAQTVIDTFIASGEDKWVRSSGIVLLLPHGYDGQGPDHSSARVERFLQLCSELDEPAWPEDQAAERAALGDVNMHVLNMSTPAQYFHALRRHMLLPVRKPLIIFTPKYLLHHRPCASALEELGTGNTFQPVLQDALFLGEDAQHSPKEVRRVVLCSGKTWYHLAHRRRALGLESKIALVRIEQLCPFPFYSLRQVLAPYLCNNDVEHRTELVWAQEEPKNMGAWTYVEPRLRWVLLHTATSSANATHIHERPVRPFSYCGRPPAASPATGSFAIHRQEMSRLVDDALTLPSD